MKPLKSFAFGLVVLGAIYLLVTAPPPLDASANVGMGNRPLDVTRMFDTLDAINATTRTIYTKRIVGAGLKAGLKFGEDWADPGVEKGPLPALFLRLVAARLEAKPPRLGLYLGSDQPINKSNLFNGAQAKAFEEVKASQAAQFRVLDGLGAVALYPDFASAEPCVTCHNDHPDSPKINWRLGDVMGATTWTYPKDRVGAADYLATTEALYEAVEEGYAAYLGKARAFQKPPLIGTLWPEPGLAALPSVEVFMAEIRRQTAETVLVGLVLTNRAAE